MLILVVLFKTGDLLNTLWHTRVVSRRQVQDLFASFTLMWQEARTCSEMIEFSKAIKWKDLIPEGFEDTATKLMSMVRTEHAHFFIWMMQGRGRGSGGGVGQDPLQRHVRAG